jgi:hypothetical protein
MRSAFYFDPFNKLIRRDGISRRHGDHEEVLTTEDTEDTEDFKHRNTESLRLKCV